VAFRDVVPLDEFGSVALPLESLHEVANVLLQLLLVRVRADVIHAVRRRLPDVLPTLAEIRLIEQLIEVAKPMLRLRSGLLRYPLQEG
jgi:hypothetical protein